MLIHLAPAPEELLELVEKQDLMMDCLLQKLEMCQEQIKLLREADLKRVGPALSRITMNRFHFLLLVRM